MLNDLKISLFLLDKMLYIYGILFYFFILFFSSNKYFDVKCDIKIKVVLIVL
jgi:hypothetical protein